MIKYKIIDNFLDEDDFKNLCSIDIGNVSKSEIKIFLIKMCELLEIKTDIVVDFPTNLKSTDRLIDLCKYYGGTEYLSGSGARAYLDTDKFKNIKVRFQDNLNKVHSLQVIKEKNEVS